MGPWRGHEVENEGESVERSEIADEPSIAVEDDVSAPAELPPVPSEEPSEEPASEVAPEPERGRAGRVGGMVPGDGEIAEGVDGAEQRDEALRRVVDPMLSLLARLRDDP
jgi:hypothetical protein